jgi:hypothetical protein
MGQIITGQVSVGTATPTAVNAPQVNPTRIHIHNNDNTNNLLVGTSTMTLTTGMALPKLDSLEITLPPNTVIYLLASSGTINASYMIVGD